VRLDIAAGLSLQKEGSEVVQFHSLAKAKRGSDADPLYFEKGKSWNINSLNILKSNTSIHTHLVKTNLYISTQISPAKPHSTPSTRQNIYWNARIAFLFPLRREHDGRLGIRVMNLGMSPEGWNG